MVIELEGSAVATHTVFGVLEHVRVTHFASIFEVMQNDACTYLVLGRNKWAHIGLQVDKFASFQYQNFYTLRMMVIASTTVFRAYFGFISLFFLALVASIAA